MATIEARRRASAAYVARLEAAGHRKVTVRLTPDAAALLETLAARHGSTAATITAALQALHAQDSKP